jgi:DNA replication protein DnaC
MQKLDEVITTEVNLKQLQTIPSLYQENAFECALCEDSGSVFGTYIDAFSKQELECMKPCQCLEPKRAEFILNQMPALYKTADLSNIQPWSHKHKKQETILKEIKANPFASYLFLGNSGVGKSFISWALWKNAALSGRRAIATTAAELMREYRHLEVQSDAVRPKVLPTDLAQDQFKYTLLLDEIEKIRVSVFSMEKLFELVKNAVDYGHQLVVTSNMRDSELKRTFGQIDEVWGSAIMRRLVENTTIVEMFK